MNFERTGQHLWTDNNPQKLILPPHWICYHTAPGQALLRSLTGGWDKGGEKWWLALKRNSAKWTKRQSSDIEAHIVGCSTLSWRAHRIQHSFLQRGIHRTVHRTRQVTFHLLCLCFVNMCFSGFVHSAVCWTSRVIFPRLLHNYPSCLLSSLSLKPLFFALPSQASSLLPSSNISASVHTHKRLFYRRAGWQSL